MSPKVMIADDERQIHQVLKSMLKAGTYRFQDAYNGAQVLEGARSDPPDLILLDVNMPDKSGLKVLEELRRDPKTRDLRVMLMTGDTEARERAGRMDLGVDDCITKPFDPAGLKARMEEMLGRSAAAVPAARAIPGPDVADIVEALQAVRDKLVELDRKYSAADQLALRHIQALHARLCRIEGERAVSGALKTPEPRAGSRARRLLPLAVSAGALAVLLGALQLRSVTPVPAVPAAPVLPAAPALSGAPVLPAVPSAPVVPGARVVIPAGPVPAGPALQSVRVQSFRVSFVTSQPVAARAYLGPQSGDLIVDLPGVATRLPGDRFRGRGGMIRGVRTNRVRFPEGPGVRSRISLRGPVGYQLRSEGNATIVDLYYGGRQYGR